HSHVQHVVEYPADAGPSANVEGKDFGDSFERDEDDEANIAPANYDQYKQENNRLLQAVGTFDPDIQSQDNLKRINGIGPVMEQKLHQLGIFTFDQVSRMGEEEYALLDEIISEFPGRARRDDWAGQALMFKNER